MIWTYSVEAPSMKWAFNQTTRGRNLAKRFITELSISIPMPGERPISGALHHGPHMAEVVYIVPNCAYCQLTVGEHFARRRCPFASTSYTPPGSEDDPKWR